jgi:hypothetical protein
MPTASTTDIILPLGADVPGSFQVDLAQPTPPAATNAVYVITSLFYEVLTTIKYVMTTDATAGNRLAAVSFVDQNGLEIAHVIAAAAQGPNVSATYTFSTSVTSLAPAGTVSQTVQMPVELLFPLYTVSIGFRTIVGAADTITALSVGTQRYPTGPVSEQTPPSVPLATPLAV